MNYAAIVLLVLLITPLVASLILLWIGKKLPKIFSVLAISFAAILPLSSFLLITINSTFDAVKLVWFRVDDYSIELSYEFNSLTLTLLTLVSVIYLLVVIYSVGYMKDDTSKPRFFSTLSFFVFNMIGLTLSGNLFQLFIFWELVGLSSYLLIGFYRYKPEAARASTKALIMNKVGDAGFLIALMMLWTANKNFELSNIENSQFVHDFKPAIGGFLLLAIFAKSAQFPFHTWLLSAMEGPTPVSALIHSATMVAAGVFLLVRVHFLFTPEILTVVAIIGALTSILGGLNALREGDLKRFLAWSTISQLGLMVMMAGNAAFNSSFLHLITHAVFKAGLFLMAGILIKHYHALQLNKKLPTRIDSIFFLIISLLLGFSLIGVPFTTGFLSKEAMLAQLSSPVFIVLFFLINLLSIAYTIRLLTFLWPGGITNVPLKFEKATIIPVAVLAIVCLGLPIKALLPENLSFPSTTLTVVSVLWTLGSTLIFYWLYRTERVQWIERLIPTIQFDNWLKAIFVTPTLAFSNVAAKTDYYIDRTIHLGVYLKFSVALIIGWIDRFIVDGIVLVGWQSVRFVGKAARQTITGNIQTYLLWTLFALIILLIWAR